MTSQLSQPSASISARDIGRNGAGPSVWAQKRGYAKMSRAPGKADRGLGRGAGRDGASTLMRPENRPSAHDCQEEAMEFGASMFFTDYSMTPAALARAL